MCLQILGLGPVGFFVGKVERLVIERVQEARRVEGGRQVQRGQNGVVGGNGEKSFLEGPMAEFAQFVAVSRSGGPSLPRRPPENLVHVPGHNLPVRIVRRSLGRVDAISMPVAQAREVRFGTVDGLRDE